MATALDIRAPAEQSEGTRSQVLRWLKSIGESVAENEPLIEIETDKVTVEVASPGTGVLTEIVKGEQEEIEPGEVLGRIATGAAAKPTAGGPVGVAAGGPPEAAAGASPELAAGGPPEMPARVAAAAAVTASAAVAGASNDSAVAGAANDSAARVAPAAGGVAGELARRLSPAVRRLLTENSLQPEAIHGTGQGGRITVEDVLAAIASRAERPRGTAQPATSGAAADSASGASARPAASGSTPAADAMGPSHRIPHTAVRKRIAEHMVQSLLHVAPHVTTVFEADLSAVLADRQRRREEFASRGAPLTLTAYFLLAAVDAIRAVPQANSRWTDSALEVFDAMHIGVGTALEEGGLVVPVLRDVQSRDLFSVAAGLNDLVTRAREGKLTPADVRGGTFTISNHGVSGSLLATPIIINQPQSAILGIGKLEKRAVVVSGPEGDRIEIRPRCYVTLTLDHRVMDGHQANRFLDTFVGRLTNWTG